METFHSPFLSGLLHASTTHHLNRKHRICTSSSSSSQIDLNSITSEENVCGECHSCTTYYSIDDEDDRRCCVNSDSNCNINDNDDGGGIGGCDGENSNVQYHKLTIAKPQKKTIPVNSSKIFYWQFIVYILLYLSPTMCYAARQEGNIF